MMASLAQMERELIVKEAAPGSSLPANSVGSVAANGA
jgi:hypothetical protein